MKGALSLDMLRGSDMTLVERQQQQQEQRFRTGFTCGGRNPDLGLENGWSDLKIHHLQGPSLHGSSSSNDSVSTTSAAMAENSSGQENVSSSAFKKRKAHHLQNAKAVVEEHNLHESKEGDSKVTEENSKKSCSSSRKSIKKDTTSSSTTNKVEKPDYIHVRARRGQATDSHSLAERVRREKISERMRYLQGLVPGCATITGKAGMLDEIINYVQSLQHQVEFLSMKLATVNPSLGYNNIDNFLMKEITHASSPSFHQMCGFLPETPNPTYLQINASQQVGSSCGLDTEMTSDDMGLRSLTCAPLSAPADPFLASSCLAQMQPSTSWDVELQSLYIMAFDQGRAM